LTEQIAYELKVKEQKLKTELSQARRENNLYLKNVDKAKMIENIHEKKKRKLHDTIQQDNSTNDSVNQVIEGASLSQPNHQIQQIKRKFKQRKIIQKQEKQSKTKVLISKFFGPTTPSDLD
jgi:ESF2/ABP1 family protein